MGPNQIQFVLALMLCLVCVSRGLPTVSRRLRGQIHKRNTLPAEGGTFNEKAREETGLKSIGEADEKDADDLENLSNIYCKASKSHSSVGPNEVPKSKERNNSFSEGLCRSFIARINSNFQGRIGSLERVQVFNYINDWTERYKLYGRQNTGYLSFFDFLNAMGFAVGEYYKNAFNNLGNRYKNQDGNISFDDFIISAAHMMTMIDEFNKRTPEDSISVTFKLDQFLEVVTV